MRADIFFPENNAFHISPLQFEDPFGFSLLLHKELHSAAKERVFNLEEILLFLMATTRNRIGKKTNGMCGRERTTAAAEKRGGGRHTFSHSKVPCKPGKEGRRIAGESFTCGGGGCGGGGCWFGLVGLFRSLAAAAAVQVEGGGGDAVRGGGGGGGNALMGEIGMRRRRRRRKKYM